MTIHIDGQQGEGGGQVLRTALTLSMCTGTPVHIDHIRSGRRKPGLMRSHLAAVVAASTICDGEVRGAELGATSLEFIPGNVKAGNYSFAIGSAGSTTLLAQTVLPALALATGHSTLSVAGGTHNGMAPSTDFMELALLPCLRQMGLDVSAMLERHGFYPNGGGHWCVEIGDWQPRALALTERGDLIDARAVVTIANIGNGVAEREMARLQKKLQLPDTACEIVQPPANGPGNIVSVRLAFEHACEVFESVGALGVSAERVAGRAASAAKQYMKHRHPVGTHLADQLLVPMALGGGGVFVTDTLSLHTRTNIAVIETFLGTGTVACVEHGPVIEVSVAPREGLPSFLKAPSSLTP